jgi:DnaJ-class molecular chaperone
MRNISDYYQALGVGQSASQDEVKRAYRRLAKEHHPDRNPDNPAAEKRFKEVQQAYEVLGDTDKRAQYDQFGKAGVGQWSTNEGGKNVYQWGGQSSINRDDLEDLMSAFGGGDRRASVFQEFFGGGRTARGGRPGARRGSDVEHPLAITFEQAARGCTVGVEVTDPRAAHPERLDVKIPPGVEDGQKIRLKGRGGAAAGAAPPGDLFLCCSVAPHRYFSRQGADVFVDVPVTVAEASLGGKIEVPSIDGRMILTIPPGTPSGTKLRLKHHGVAKRGGLKRGDQYVVIQIVPSTTLTDEERRAFRKIHDLDNSDPRAKCDWWGD